MFNADPEVFQCGAEVLPVGTHHMNVENMVRMHVESCKKCNSAGGLEETCYFFKMKMCIERGWKVPVNESRVKPKYKVKEDNDKKITVR
jgi:hypothetical protein